MSDLFADGVILPMIFLVVIGWIVPQLLAKFMPEGVRPLMIIALLATFLIWLLAALFFVGIYVWRGTTLDGLTLTQGFFYFGRLGLLSGLLWVPVMLLSVANLPRHWVKEVW